MGIWGRGIQRPVREDPGWTGNEAEDERETSAIA